MLGRYANAGNKHIAAAIEKLYRFEKEQDAIDKLDNIQSHFITSNQQVDDIPKKGIVLWIKDYDITHEEEEQGYMGNYAFLTYEVLEDGLYTLSTTKLDTELKYHPRRKRNTNEAMPNWGHPILRSVKKGKIYPTLEAVEAEFEQLHREYPQTTVPSREKLFIMVYSRAENPDNPVQRYALEIKQVQGGGFVIDCSLNEYQKEDKVTEESADLAEEAPPQGYFTAKIALQRKKRPKN